MPEDKREILKSRLMREFAIQYFESDGKIYKLMDMMGKKTMMDFIVDSGEYKKLSDKAVDNLLASENSLNELYKAFVEYA